MPRATIDELLAVARHGLTRLDPTATRDAMRCGAALIDIRDDSQLAQDGVIAGALVIPRNVLEWRLDPTSRHRHPHAPDLDAQVILMCNEGYQSSLAAATLQQLGFTHATDLDGGFQAWRAAGLPVQLAPEKIAAVAATTQRSGAPPASRSRRGSVGPVSSYRA